MRHLRETIRPLQGGISDESLTLLVMGIAPSRVLVKPGKTGHNKNAMIPEEGPGSRGTKPAPPGNG